MKKNRKLMLIVALITIVFGMAHAGAALAMSNKIIKQRIEDQAADTFRLRGTKVDIAVEDGYVVLSEELTSIFLFLPPCFEFNLQNHL